MGKDIKRSGVVCYNFHMPSEKQRLFDYYDERAPEYEAFYYGGKPAYIPDPDAYRGEVAIISKLLPTYISGNCIDIACGTGFWLPFYEKNCPEITLIDQSQSMLAECSQKVKKLGVQSKAEVICDDLFSYPLRQSRYDSALIGFLLSHLTDAEEQDFFNILKRILKAGGKFFIIDSVWSQEMRVGIRNKTGFNKRRLHDGREFTIFKRYFEKQDLHDLAERHGLDLDVIHSGKVFVAAAGSVPSG